MKKNLCVVLHLYYTDLFEYFYSYLKNIREDHDIYITLIEGHYEESILETIESKLKNSKVFILENKGMDIAPFFFVLNEINKRNVEYDCILKLHTKKSLVHGASLGENWRNELIMPLLYSSERITDNLSIIKNDSKYKMLASHKWILPTRVKGFETIFTSTPIDNSRLFYQFVGGTMFMVDFKLIMDWFVQENIFERFDNEFPKGYVADDTIAHHLERLFGYLIHIKNCSILGV
jgi:lipopolysaccharide biosynthesis protein